MSKIYVVKHIYDVDGGYGDAVYNEEIVFITSNKEEAEAWVEHWDHSFTYNTPYAELTCCSFSVEEMDVMDHIDIHTPPTKFESFSDVGHIGEIENDDYEDITLTDPEEIHQQLLDICEKERIEKEEREHKFEEKRMEIFKEWFKKYHGQLGEDIMLGRMFEEYASRHWDEDFRGLEYCGCTTFWWIIKHTIGIEPTFDENGRYANIQKARDTYNKWLKTQTIY